MIHLLKKCVIAVTLVAMTIPVYARSWQINNNPNYVADFSSINAAISSADVLNGDTLYIGAGCNMGDAQTISKKVTVIGTGWGYTDSPALASRITNYLNINSADVKIIGLHITGEVNIYNHNIVLERCKIDGQIRPDNTKRKNVKILQSIINIINTSPSYGNYNYQSDNWTIKNCIIKNSDHCLRSIYNSTIENNIIINNSTGTDSKASLVAYSQLCTIRNNVLIQTNPGGEGSILYGSSNCVCTDNVISVSADWENNFPENTYLGSNDPATVFKCTGSVAAGEYYSLKENSPAAGAGESGADCGVMAGAYKFVPYGRPDYIPVIKKLVVPEAPTNGEINVTIGF